MGLSELTGRILLNPVVDHDFLIGMENGNFWYRHFKCWKSTALRRWVNTHVRSYANSLSQIGLGT